MHALRRRSERAERLAAPRRTADDRARRRHDGAEQVGRHARCRRLAAVDSGPARRARAARVAAVDAPRPPRRCRRARVAARAGDEERRAGVQQHDVARRPALAGQHAPDDRRVLGGIAALAARRPRLRQPDVAGCR